MEPNAARELIRIVTSSVLGIEVQVNATGAGEKIRFEVLVPRTFVSRAIGRRGETARAMHHLVRESMNQPFEIRIAAIEDAPITVVDRSRSDRPGDGEVVWN